MRCGAGGGCADRALREDPATGTQEAARAEGDRSRGDVEAELGIAQPVAERRPRVARRRWWRSSLRLSPSPRMTTTIVGKYPPSPLI
jgi:hypothetical protein